MKTVEIKLTDRQLELIVAKLQSEQPEPLEGTDLEIVENHIKSHLSVQATEAKTKEAIEQLDVTPEEVK